VLEHYGYPVISKEVSQKIHEMRNTNSEKLYNKRLNGDDKGNGKLPYKYRYLLEAPFKISSKCCDVMKKSPLKMFEKFSGLSPIVGTMASDSSLRKTTYLRQGCNSFTDKRNMSRPLSFWTEIDIWNYLKGGDVSYAEVYNKGFSRTGCMYCLFGMHLEKVDRFDLMNIHYPKIHNYCMNKLGLKDVLRFIKHKGG
jgi:3'-phosphoadenosine 5'-phosphosulfate sulfotransferase (PAPS reductase)/FAD synthetase